MTDFDFPSVIKNSPRFYPLAKLTDRFFNLPTWRANLGNIRTVDPSFYPYLADELDIAETQAWQLAKSDKERVYLLETAHQRKAQIGTAAGLKQAADEAGGEVVRVFTPTNGRFFLSANETIAERNARLSQYPEMRFYPRRLPGKKEGSLTVKNFLGACYPARSSAALRARLRVTLVKNGIETELESFDWQIASVEKQAINEVRIKSYAGFGAFLGRTISFLSRSNADTRRYVIQDITMYQESTAKLSLRTLVPSMTPVHVDGEMVAEVRPVSKGVTFLGRFFRFLASSQADLATYRRVWLFDPSLPITRARASSHLGYSRMGFPAHTAEVQAALYSKQTPAGMYMGLPAAAHDRKPLQRLLANMRLATRESDEIWVNTKIFKPVTMSPSVKMGDHVMGAISNT